MPECQIGIAVLGCGGIASQYHLPALSRNPRARVVAIADPAPAARARAVALAPGAEAVAEPRVVLDRPDVDAVVVCADNRQHGPLAMAALAAGKHLYLEKPLALSAEDGRALVAAESVSGVVAAIGFNLRFHPLHQRAHVMLGDDVVGTVRRARAIFREPARRRRMPDWKRARSSGGGALLDLGSHTVDLLRWHLRDEVADIDRVVVASRSTEHDTARLRLRMDSGVDADVSCRIGATRADVFEVEGDRGTLRIDRHRCRISLRRQAGPSMDPLPRRLARRFTRSAPEPSFERALEAFIGRLQGVENDLPTLGDGLRSLETVLAAETAAGF